MSILNPSMTYQIKRTLVLLVLMTSNEQGEGGERIVFIFYASSSFSFKESWLNETATQLQDTHVNVPSLEIEIL